MLRLGQGRVGRPQPDQRLRQGPGLRLHRPARRALQHGAVDGVVAEGRPARLLRAHREGAHADHPERPHHERSSSALTMKTVDEPESPSFSPDGKTVAFSALRGAIGDIFTVDLETRRGHQPDERRVRRLRPDVLARRQVHRLHRARQRQREAVPPRPRHEEEDAADLRHARRDARRSSSTTDTLVFSSTATDPAQAARTRGGEERQHLQHLDARPEERRAAAVHRRARRQPVARRPERRRRRSRIAFVTYYKGEYGSTRSSARSRCTPPRAPTSARPGPIIDFQAPLSHTLVAANKDARGHVREDVPRGAAAGERRRHERRRRLRRHAGHFQRRARRPAVQLLRRVDLAVPDARRLATMNLSRRFQYALQGFSQTQFFYGRPVGRLLRPGAGAVHRPRPGAWRRGRSAAARAFGIYPFNRYRRVELSGGARTSSTRSTTTRASQAYIRRTSSSGAASGLPQRHRSCRFGVAFVQETTVFREFGPLAGSTMRLGYDVAPKIGDLALAADHRRRRALLPAPRRPAACWRCASAGSRAWATTRTSCTSAATPRCAATTTCSSSAQNVVFANAELRFPLIEAVLTPIGVDRRHSRRRSSPTSAAAGSTARSFKFCDEDAEQVHDDRRLQADVTGQISIPTR